MIDNIAANLPPEARSVLVGVMEMEPDQNARDHIVETCVRVCGLRAWWRRSSVSARGMASHGRSGTRLFGLPWGSSRVVEPVQLFDLVEILGVLRAHQGVRAVGPKLCGIRECERLDSGHAKGPAPVVITSS
jgi:hypothetical protein